MNSWGTLPTGSGATAYPETPRQTTRTQSGAQQRPGDWEQVDQLMTLRPGPAGAGGASAPMSLAGVTNLRVSIPAAAFGLRVWEDPRRIGGVDLRYWLLRRLHTRSHEIHTVAGLVEQLHAAGFTVRGRVSKTVSDALATETSKGRIVRTGWGRYRAGLPIPKTTWWRVCNRTGVLQRRLEKQLHQIAERYFHHWRSHAPIPADRVAKLWKTLAAPTRISGSGWPPAPCRPPFRPLAEQKSLPGGTALKRNPPPPRTPPVKTQSTPVGHENGRHRPDNPNPKQSENQLSEHHSRSTDSWTSPHHETPRTQQQWTLVGSRFSTDAYGSGDFAPLTERCRVLA